MLDKIKKYFPVIFIITVVGLLVAMIWNMGLDTLTDRDKLTEYIGQFGVWAPLVFITIQTLQVIAAPIPGNITGLVGGAMFGMIWGSVYNSVSVVLGSMFMFWLGNKYGMAAVNKFVKPETVEKYMPKLNGKKAKGVLLGLFLVPFAPDDAICLLAGITDLTFLQFLVYVVIGRIPSCIITNAMGAGLYSGSTLTIGIYAVIYYIIVFTIYSNFDKIKNRFTNKTM
ncbi:MAG: TVP38/TMEM64 family protein [Eubacteriaceae bacterium]|nr:TVP38/TMEM64 family protein [Eubacteriaceae bacterium]